MSSIESGNILVINPNSSEAVTRAIDAAVEPLRAASPFPIIVTGLRDTPSGIALQSDADQVAPPVLQTMLAHPARGYVVACFSDPGVTGAREVIAAPVRGIGESAILHAMTRADRFGVIALSASSVLRQRRLVRVMGVAERYAGSRAVDARAEETTNDALLDRMNEAAFRLVADGADIIIMGCAGMAHFRARIEAHCQRPVVEPTRAAVAALIGDCLLRSCDV
ncbi:hydantoin racemase [Acetobacter nitrogenifigens DSM 23921 = NBRC 105050]|uniref:Hydantoin racemase n=1 Tax=Acetobacter nitrogenifigens DSM 23921 = NBRC 105050 TaxID=1120919 RepID=A0A511X8P2_9PROT|nr:aspartate/glutamate racemase family protein [Acetobacter nitrogenifigens]GBQ87615.1 hydantoin racemase [Acetobacter nitrogenifigens DSM 23921 = NBRC 105050]GEN59302.1 hydantoin racemase [Acetobacter nitrogenifigens DSM 23921 = NBRC 105050]